MVDRHLRAPPAGPGRSGDSDRDRVSRAIFDWSTSICVAKLLAEHAKASHHPNRTSGVSGDMWVHRIPLAVRRSAGSKTGCEARGIPGGGQSLLASRRTFDLRARGGRIDATVMSGTKMQGQTSAATRPISYGLARGARGLQRVVQSVHKKAGTCPVGLLVMRQSPAPSILFHAGSSPAALTLL